MFFMVLYKEPKYNYFQYSKMLVVQMCMVLLPKCNVNIRVSRVCVWFYISIGSLFLTNGQFLARKKHCAAKL